MSVLTLLTHPYEELVPVTGGRAALREGARRPGSAVVWAMPDHPRPQGDPLVDERPGGLALIVVLPEAGRISDPTLVNALQRCRPNGILPHHQATVADLAQVLRRPPVDLAAEVTDYLSWRGLGIDRDTTHLIRRILDLSAELRSVTALSRSMYLSRRALGRRLMNRGLPVPSHWLQLGRLLRVAMRLQNSEASLFSIAYESGYPDGFSLSNQMHRLIGYRPSQVREHLGWEWIVEEWLRREAEAGGLSPPVAASVEVGSRSIGAPPASAPMPRGRPARSRRGASA